MRASGLTSAEAAKRLSETGPNEVYRRRKISFPGIARHEITEPMILLLLFIGIVYSVWGELFDAITIIFVITALVLVEVTNEYRAKAAISALERIAEPRARVVRDSRVTTVPSGEIVPGDLIVLTPGTKVPADAKIVRAVALLADESALTGESFPVGKHGDDEVSAGTVIVSGEGDAEVVVTGPETRIGQLAASAQEIKPPKTRLQLEMKALAGKLVYVAVFFSVLITAIGLIRGNDPKTMILTGLSLSFATIPEELPIIITMVLGLGAYQLSKKNFLVRKLPAAETMGNITVIVTDKTGTLTEGKMTIAAVYPETSGGDHPGPLAAALGGIPLYSESPIDLAIQDRAGSLGIPAAGGTILRQRDIGDGRKTRALLRLYGRRRILIVAGAPEEVFGMCRGVPEGAAAFLGAQTAEGRRVIGVATREVSDAIIDEELPSLEKDLALAGLISFEDPPREGVKETIAKAASAGIRTIMVTGDHPDTAGAVARGIGILGPSGPVMTGKDIDLLPDDDLSTAVKAIQVFARTSPGHKYRIVQALRKNGEVVAVTGDGINDALALRGADIGIAMGIRGTDVAKDAAGVVLTDDNYITITNGIFEGRKFEDNLRKGIRYYLSIKAALVAIFLLPVIAGIPLPFAPIQIIVLELFMDLGASAGFVAEPAERDISTRPPPDPDAGIFSGGMLREIAVNAAALFAAVTGVYLVAGYLGMGVGTAQTCAFSAWIFGHIALAYISRTGRDPLRSIGIFSNRVINLWAAAAIVFLFAGLYLPALNRAIHLDFLSPGMVILIGFIVSAFIGTVGLARHWRRAQGRTGSRERQGGIPHKI